MRSHMAVTSNKRFRNNRDYHNNHGYCSFAGVIHRNIKIITANYAINNQVFRRTQEF